MEVPPKPKRKPSSTAVARRAAAETARATGQLPHEILLEIARGTPLIQSRMEWDEGAQVFKAVAPVVLIPDLQMRMAAARDAAPYYAPKLSALEILQGMTDDQLDEALAVLAAEAGFGAAAAGEGPPAQAATGAARPGDAPAIRPDGDIAGDAGGASAP